MFIVIFCSSLIVSSCGKKSSEQLVKAKVVETSPIVVEKPVENVNTPFVGDWGGYLDNSYTIITIKSDGNASIESSGEPVRIRSIFLQDNRYYLVNNQTKTGVPLKVNGNILTLTIGKSEVSFIKDE